MCRIEPQLSRADGTYLAAVSSKSGERAQKRRREKTSRAGSPGRRSNTTHPLLDLQLLPSPPTQDSFPETSPNRCCCSIFFVLFVLLRATGGGEDDVGHGPLEEEAEGEGEAGADMVSPAPHGWVGCCCAVWAPGIRFLGNQLMGRGRGGRWGRHVRRTGGRGSGLWVRGWGFIKCPDSRGRQR